MPVASSSATLAETGGKNPRATREASNSEPACQSSFSKVGAQLTLSVRLHAQLLTLPRTAAVCKSYFIGGQILIILDTRSLNATTSIDALLW